MRPIGFEEFQVNTVTCEIDGEECDEWKICTTCKKAILARC
ncbi:hypothetical protein [uncultured Methanomethylovorans sp.]|nr:hypothetical protein [uncultured Methanomethylovorans sp.]